MACYTTGRRQHLRTCYREVRFIDFDGRPVFKTTEGNRARKLGRLQEDIDEGTQKGDNWVILPRNLPSN